MTINLLFTNLYQALLNGALHPVYSGSDLSSTWIETLRHAIEGLIASISTPTGSMALNWLGRLAPLLILPAAIGLRYLYRNTSSKEEKWSFHLLLAGLLITLAGLAAGARVAEIKFYLTVFSMLCLSISAGIYYVLTAGD